MDIHFLWIHGYLDTLDIKFFHYLDFGYPIQVSGYFWILFLSYCTWEKGKQIQVLRLFSMFILSIGIELVYFPHQSERISKLEPFL